MAAPAASIKSWSWRKRSPPARGGWYSGSASTAARIGVYAVAAKGVGLDKVEAGIDRVLHELRENPVSADELERAKKAFIADFIYESDSQARWRGVTAKGLVLGMTIEQINDWPAAIAKVTAEDIKRVANQVLGYPQLGDRHPVSRARRKPRAMASIHPPPPTNPDGGPT